MPPDDEDASDRQGREEPAEADRITLACSHSPTEARDAHAMLDRMITRGRTSREAIDAYRKHVEPHTLHKVH